MTPKQAIGQPRMHHQWLPDRLYVEQPLFAKVANALKERGHAVEKARRISCQADRIDV